MIAWKDPAVELPEDGAQIWIMEQSQAKNGWLSCQIIGAVVRFVKTEFSEVLLAENQDSVYLGWQTWVLRDFKGHAKRNDIAVAWCALEEVNLPGFIQHRRKSES